MVFLLLHSCFSVISRHLVCPFLGLLVGLETELKQQDGSCILTSKSGNEKSGVPIP